MLWFCYDMGDILGDGDDRVHYAETFNHGKAPDFVAVNFEEALEYVNAGFLSARFMVPDYDMGDFWTKNKIDKYNRSELFYSIGEYNADSYREKNIFVRFVTLANGFKVPLFVGEIPCSFNDIVLETERLANLYTDGACNDIVTFNAYSLYWFPYWTEKND